MTDRSHTESPSAGTRPRAAAPFTRSKPTIAFLALATIAVLAWLDHLSGTQVSMTALYLLPVAAVAWYLGRSAGRLFALAAGAAQLVADLVAIGSSLSVPAVVWNAATIVVLSFVVVEVLGRLHGSLNSEHELARTDPLTGVANSRSFHELAAAELERCRRYGRSFTVACLDLDHFKTVNDTMGHARGDDLLRDVGRVLRSGLRRVDIVARLGGDEFTLLLPETGAGPASVALEHVRRGLDSLTSEYGPHVKASIGAVTYTEPPASVGELVRVADTAMYRAKAGGRDRVESLTLPAEADRLEEMELIALRALAPLATLPTSHAAPDTTETDSMAASS